MKRPGRTLLIIAAALLTLQGLTVMAGPPLRLATSGGREALATPDRQVLVREILDLWETAPNPVVAENRTLYGDLRSALKLATVEQLREARQGRTYEDVWAALPKGAATSTAVVALAAGQGITPQLIGDATADLVYTPVTPCRIIDTRAGIAPYTGILGPNSGRLFYASLADSSPQGGFAGSCGIPTSPYPAAIAINVTSTGQTGYGNLKVTQTCAGLPITSLVNYWAFALNVANAAIVPMAHNACGMSGDIFIYSSGSQSHAVVDILGYFNPPAATLLDTTVVSNDFFCALGAGCQSTVACPAGYVVTGGGFQGCCFNTNWVLERSAPWFNGWTADVLNNSGDQNLTVYAICARIPGH